MLVVLYLVAIAGLAGGEDNYAYFHGKCATLESGGPGVHWGISEKECAEIASVNKKLNGAYKSKLRTLDRIDRDHLRQIQLRWIASTNKLCAMADDGLINNENSSSCFLAAARKRIDYLLSFRSRAR